MADEMPTTYMSITDEVEDRNSTGFSMNEEHSNLENLEPRIQRDNSTSKCCFQFSIALFIIVSAGLGLFGTHFYLNFEEQFRAESQNIRVLYGKINDLEYQLNNERNERNSQLQQFESILKILNNTVESSRDSIWINENNISDLEKDINSIRIFLGNMTSNEDVLAELERVKNALQTKMVDVESSVSGKLITTQTSVLGQLANVQRNISSQLRVSNTLVSTKLLENDKSVKDSLYSVSNLIQQAKSNISAQVLSVSTNVKTKLMVVDDKLSQTRALVSTQMDLVKVNVSEQMKSARSLILAELNTQLGAVNTTLQSTMVQVQAQLDYTMTTLHSAVADTVTHIQSVQQNVTSTLSAMNIFLDGAVVQLNSAVDSAKSAIHDEVVEVKQNMDQYIVVTNHQFAIENDFVKYQLAGTFTLLGCLISLWHQTTHARHFESPDVQSRVLAILSMVPIYSITSWLALVIPSAEFIFGAVRDCYEAYAVYTFFAFLIAVLAEGRGIQQVISKMRQHIQEELEAEDAAREEHEQAQQQLDADAKRGVRRPVSPFRGFFSSRQKLKKHKTHYKPPLTCFYNRRNPHATAASIVWQCQFMCLQFVLLKPLLAVLPFILQAALHMDDYHSQPMFVGSVPNWTNSRLYVSVIQNLSVATAFYGLLSFYHATAEELAWCEPWPKFLCIKGVVFMTFWQGLGIQVMSTMGLVDEKSSSQIQNLLICIEMLLASLAHYYIFPYEEWRPNYKKEHEKARKQFRDPLAIGYFASDLGVMMTRRPKRQDSFPQAESAHGREAKLEGASRDASLIYNPVRRGDGESDSEVVNGEEALYSEAMAMEHKESSLSDEESSLHESFASDRPYGLIAGFESLQSLNRYPPASPAHPEEASYEQLRLEDSKQLHNKHITGSPSGTIGTGLVFASIEERLSLSRGTRPPSPANNSQNDPIRPAVHNDIENDLENGRSDGRQLGTLDSEFAHTELGASAQEIATAFLEPDVVAGDPAGYRDVNSLISLDARSETLLPRQGSDVTPSNPGSPLQFPALSYGEHFMGSVATGEDFGAAETEVGARCGGSSSGLLDSSKADISEDLISTGEDPLLNAQISSHSNTYNSSMTTPPSDLAVNRSEGTMETDFAFTRHDQETTEFLGSSSRI